MICETLGLEPNSVRFALANDERRVAATAMARSRPKVRRYAGLRRRGAHPV